MPEVVACPKCQRKSRVPDSLVGKKVKCPGCAEIFTASVNGAAPAKKQAPAKPKPEEEDEGGGGYEVVDDDDGKKKKKRRRTDDDDERVSDKPRGRRSRDDDDDDDEDRSRRSRRSRDDDDDDDERVSRKRRSIYSRDRDDDDDDDDDDEDDDYRSSRKSRMRRRGLSADWGRVHRGLTLVLASVICQILLTIVIVIIAVAVVGMAFAAAAPGPGGAPGGAGKIAGATAGVVIMGILAIVGSLVALGLKITGHYFCLPSPEAYGARALAMTTLILAVVQVGCTFVQWIITIITLGAAGLGNVGNPMAFGAASNVLATIVNWIGILAGIGLFFVFLFYLRSLALATGNTGLARSVVTFMIVVLVGPVVLVLLSCIGGFVMAAAGAAAAAPGKGGGPANPGAGLAAMGAMGIVCVGIWVLALLGIFIWWIMLLVQTRAAVGNQVRN
jgi:hypothetical protein